ncbi:ATP-binding cassette domain-containing protein [Synechococcales cyanobacterium C]|uniref:ATP-binding cassette domain-containing protein n=1 Tax=Petrachloros mirabilis ULC683 TaxID=2781853 RepID=A0A8K2ANB3_9CYAN|nr:ABC transporter ATP-binding protein [Petrachloros mirabilis]NCJ05256.1 ATP-binding cassette domain-containing protein [Petrachloros mirabilis ULC683]
MLGFTEQTEAAIAIHQLSFAYPDQRPVLQDLSLSVSKGERLGLIGHNGCGKTTLFLLIAGILTPLQGDIAVLGEIAKPGRFRPEIGVVFQNPNDQLFSASVWEDVAFAPQNLGLPPALVQARVQEALAVTGTTALANRAPHHLSGGEKRMVAIAGVLAMVPQILLYDEPTANLDLRARRRLIQFLHQSQQTMVIASHDLEFILEVCDRVALMEVGCIAAQGTPQQMMSNTTLMHSHGLEVPHSLAERYPTDKFSVR